MRNAFNLPSASYFRTVDGLRLRSCATLKTVKSSFCINHTPCAHKMKYVTQSVKFQCNYLKGGTPGMREHDKVPSAADWLVNFLDTSPCGWPMRQSACSVQLDIIGWLDRQIWKIDFIPSRTC